MSAWSPYARLRGKACKRLRELLHRCGHGAGQFGQQDLTGFDIGQGLHAVGVDDVVVEDTALDDQVRIRLGEVTKCLGHRDDVTRLPFRGVCSTNASAVGPTRNSSMSIPASLAARRTRVFLYTLYDPPAGRSSRRSVDRALTFRPRYSVTYTAPAVVEPFAHLVDDRDLFRSWVLHHTSFRFLLLVGCWLRRTQRPNNHRLEPERTRMVCPCQKRSPRRDASVDELDSSTPDVFGVSIRLCGADSSGVERIRSPWNDSHPGRIARTSHSATASSRSGSGPS